MTVSCRRFHTDMGNLLCLLIGQTVRRLEEDIRDCLSSSRSAWPKPQVRYQNAKVNSPSWTSTSQTKYQLPGLTWKHLVSRCISSAIKPTTTAVSLEHGPRPPPGRRAKSCLTAVTMIVTFRRHGPWRCQCRSIPDLSTLYRPFSWVKHNHVPFKSQAPHARPKTRIRKGGSFFEGRATTSDPEYDNHHRPNKSGLLIMQ